MALKPGTAEVAKYAETVAKVWQPHPVFVMDIAQTEDGSMHLLEIGSINCAGLYCCEIRPIVEAMSIIAEKELNSK